MEMGKKICGIVLLLLFLFTNEMVMQAEGARNCYSKSKWYHGRCFFKNHVNNCKTICKQESFITGSCTRGTCFCAKPCAAPSHPPPPPPESEEPGEPGGPGDDDSGGEAINL